MTWERETFPQIRGTKWGSLWMRGQEYTERDSNPDLYRSSVQVFLATT